MRIWIQIMEHENWRKLTSKPYFLLLLCLPFVGRLLEPSVYFSCKRTFLWFNSLTWIRIRNDLYWFTSHDPDLDPPLRYKDWSGSTYSRNQCGSTTLFITNVDSSFHQGFASLTYLLILHLSISCVWLRIGLVNTLKSLPGTCRLPSAGRCEAAARSVHRKKAQMPAVH